MKNTLSQELGAARAGGLYRSMRSLFSRQGREVLLEGRRVLNFCSNDYLGLAGDERLSAAAVESSARYGFGGGASRLVCGNSEEHLLLEHELARFKGTEAALVFSTGYMANVGIIPALCGREDTVFSDRLNHASIVDGIILSRAHMRRYRHLDMQDLERCLQNSGKHGRKLVVTDTVFSMDGDVAPLGELTRLARRYGAWVMVDEAHAFGLFGPGGAGMVQEAGVAERVDVQMGTLSKAVGACGGYVAGSRELIDYLVNRARSFIYSTALPPAVAAAIRAGLGIMRAEPERRARVLFLAGRLRTELRRAGFNTMESVTPVIPVLIGDTFKARIFSEKLMEQDILISAIRPPTVPSGTARLRITVTALHLEEDIVRLVAALVNVRDQLA
jgi:8-amino-7-oxononanoate synthase